MEAVVLPRGVQIRLGQAMDFTNYLRVGQTQPPPGDQPPDGNTGISDTRVATLNAGSFLDDGRAYGCEIGAILRSFVPSAILTFSPPFGTDTMHDG